jgi:hypothetical protein
MIKIELGFEPHPFEKAMIEQTREDIQNRLSGHEFGRFKIVLKKPPGSQQISLQFLGDPESETPAGHLLIPPPLMIMILLMIFFSGPRLLKPSGARWRSAASPGR